MWTIQEAIETSCGSQAYTGLCRTYASFYCSEAADATASRSGGHGQNDWLRDAEAKPKIAVDTEMLM